MNTEILIAMNPEGQLDIQCRGPGSKSRVMLLGMLEQAKDLLLHPPQEESPILAAREIPGMNGNRK